MDDAKDIEMCRVIGRTFAGKFGGEADEWQSVAYLAVVAARPRFRPDRGATWETYATVAAFNALRKANLEASGKYNGRERGQKIIRSRIPVIDVECPDRHHELISNLVARPQSSQADVAREAVEELRELIADSPEELACLDAMLEFDRSWKQRPLLARMTRSSYERRKAVLRGALEMIARERGWGR